MQSVEVMFVAAGNGKRFKREIPKALAEITDGVKCIDSSIKAAYDGLIGQYQDVQITVVVSTLHISLWNDWLTNSSRPCKIKLVAISSGLGDGHAVLSARKKWRPNVEDVIICWGDTVFTADAFAEMAKNRNDAFSTESAIVPAVLEHKPYTTLFVDENWRCKGLDSAKLGECHEHGLHDQSFFLFNKKILDRSLRIMHDVFWKNTYTSLDGELHVTQMFHYLWNIGKPARVYETTFPTSSFNTEEELATIKKGNPNEVCTTT